MSNAPIESLLETVGTFRENAPTNAEGDPAAQHLTLVRLNNNDGEEAPVARAGPRSPDAFYRGEEAGAALKL